MLFVQALEVNALLHQPRRHPVGVGGGVGVDKAPGVGGHGHIEGGGDGLVHHPQVLGDLPENFAAGGLVRLQAGLFCKELLGGVVVDGQVNALHIGLGIWGQQPQGGHVHAHHRVRGVLLGSLHPLQVLPEQGGGVQAGEQPSGFAHLAQQVAQAHAAANGVPVGALVGQNEIVVVLGEKLSRFLVSHAQSSSSSTMWALAGLAGLTTLGSRSISRMWAPWSMESSRSKMSSGVWRRFSARLSSRRR